jgi:glutamate synthase (NADPH/NADH) small chain
MPTTIIDRKQRLTLPEQKPAMQDPLRRRGNWAEVNLGYTREQAMAEADRCLLCPAAPCQKACPLRNDIAGALALLASGDERAAAERYRITSPFPEICSRECPQERLCEGSCVVGKRGAPVRIGQIERFLADTFRRENELSRLTVPAPTGRAVAIVGAGPAGLAAAEDVRRAGHHVVVFDAWPRPGGVMRYGTPTFKLPRGLVAAKCDQLVAAGVEFVRRRIDQATGLEGLKSEGFDVILLTVGAGASNRLRVPGEECRGVWTATDFLVRANVPEDDLPAAYREPLAMGDYVVVIGGGDTAMDCCRTAVRLGAKDVLCLYRRTEADMPGRRVERRYAQEEGVRFMFLAAPLRLMSTEGAATGVVCTLMTPGEPDASGRCRPVPVSGSDFIVPASTVIIAAGFHVDEELDDIAPELARKPDGTVAADVQTGSTNLQGIFATGDVVAGPDLVVTAAAAGRRAAAAINAFLRS